MCIYIYIILYTYGQFNAGHFPSNIEPCQYSIFVN